MTLVLFYEQAQRTAIISISSKAWKFTANIFDEWLSAVGQIVNVYELFGALRAVPERNGLDRRAIAIRVPVLETPIKTDSWKCTLRCWNGVIRSNGTLMAQAVQTWRSMQSRANLSLRKFPHR